MSNFWRITGSDEHVLRAALSRALAESVGRAEVVSLGLEHARYASSCASYVITATMAAGDTYRVFLKDFSASKRAADDQRLKARREVGVYRDLLRRAQLDTARYFGTFSEESPERFWLLLEWVEGRQLRHCDPAHWPAAAAWLARFHAHFAQRIEELKTCAYLDRIKYTDTQTLGEIALRALAEVSTHLADRLTPIVTETARIDHIIGGLSPTLLHGAFRPQQIVMSPADAPTRVCVVDWESAAIGPGFNDLAELTLGLEAERINPLVDAYRHEATRCGLVVPDVEQSRRVVNAFRLRNTLRRLNSPAKPKGKWDAATLVTQAEALEVQCR